MALSGPEIPCIPKKRGEIRLIIGPMFAEKSTSLILAINRLRYAKKRVFVIKPKKDDRYSQDLIMSHMNHDGYQVSIPCHSVDDLYSFPFGDLINDYDVIAIDEGNFFGESIVLFAENLANNGKIVIITALNGDINQRHFGDFHGLYAKADHIEFLKSVCFDCGEDAPFTYSHIKRKEGEIVVGGEDKYVSLCRECRNERE